MFNLTLKIYVYFLKTQRTSWTPWPMISKGMPTWSEPNWNVSQTTLMWYIYISYRITWNCPCSHGAKYAQRWCCQRSLSGLQDPENSGQNVATWSPVRQGCKSHIYLHLCHRRLSDEIFARWRVDACLCCLLLYADAFVCCLFFCSSTQFCPGSLLMSWPSTMRLKCPFGKEAKEGSSDNWRSVSEEKRTPERSGKCSVTVQTYVFLFIRGFRF